MSDSPAADPTAVLPDDTPFESWEASNPSPGRAWHVDQAAAGGAGDGAAETPLATIAEAAEAAQPGDRVVVHAGVYRECVRPPRGGTGPEAMISYEAAPGEDAVIAGTERVEGRWKPSKMWRRPDGTADIRVWSVRMPRRWFVGENPFATPNRAVVSTIGGFNQAKSEHFAAYMLRRGLVFQDGRRLDQVNDFTQLFDGPGRYWPDPDGLRLHVRPAGDVDPAETEFEVTARSQGFAPDREGLGYVRVAGLKFFGFGNGFPFMPQDGAVSAARGHHWIVEGCTLEAAGGIGIEMGKRDPRTAHFEGPNAHVIRANTVRGCGICGIAGIAMTDSLIEDNLVEDCCWYDVEEMFESAGIKTHRNVNTLVRRNVVRRLAHGAGLWLDFANDNMRVTRNVVTDVATWFGGIFVEASHRPTRVDHNIVVGVRAASAEVQGDLGRGGHGLYGHDNDLITVDHNLFARCEGAAVHLPKGRADRMVGGRGSTSRDHTVAHNLCVATNRFVAFHDERNACDANLYAGSHADGPFRLFARDEWLDLETWRASYGFDETSAEIGATAALDPETLELALEVRPETPDVPRAEAVVEAPVDFLGDRRHDSAPAGPFAELAGLASPLAVDPREV